MFGLRADDDATADVPLDKDKCFVNLILYVTVDISAIDNIATVILERTYMDNSLREFYLRILGEQKIRCTSDFCCRLHPFELLQNIPWRLIIGEISPFRLVCHFHVSTDDLHVKIVASYAWHDHGVHACSSGF